MTPFNEAVQEAEEGLHHVRENAEKVKARAEEAWKEAKVYIEKHPGQVVAASVALGAIVGALIGHRKESGAPCTK